MAATASTAYQDHYEAHPLQANFSLHDPAQGAPLDTNGTLAALTDAQGLSQGSPYNAAAIWGSVGRDGLEDDDEKTDVIQPLALGPHRPPAVPHRAVVGPVTTIKYSSGGSGLEGGERASNGISEALSVAHTLFEPEEVKGSNVDPTQLETLRVLGEASSRASERGGGSLAFASAAIGERGGQGAA